MPIYEYRCENGHRFEAFQPMSDDPLATCEVCDAAVERVLSAPAVHFKGSGFYTTDYARKGEKKPVESGGAGADGKDKGSKETAKSSEPAKSSEGSSSGKGDSGSKSSEKASSGSKSD